METYQRAVVLQASEQLSRHPKLICVITGPRQSGKSTAAAEVARSWTGPAISASADLPLPPSPEWIVSHWERARAQPACLLILDEFQKVSRWCETVKGLWDKDRRLGSGPKVMLLGSSALLMQAGLSESLAGRFFLHRCPHWAFTEMNQAFGFDLDQWVFYGGYPGAAPLVHDQMAWGAYVRDSLIETVLAKDILMLQRVTKPALLRHLFMLACSYPAQILSYNKMLGQLDDAGNTTTLAHYLTLLSSAFLVCGLEQFKPGVVAKRGSSPKLVLWNNALVSAVMGIDYARARADHSYWGRLVENAAGAHLLNGLAGLPHQVMYWRDGNAEVDFVIHAPRKTWAVEVKSGSAAPGRAAGLAKFCACFPESSPLIVGHGGMPLEEFFRSQPREMFS